MKSNSTNDSQPSPKTKYLANQFAQKIAEEPHISHNVSFYANLLIVSPGHLNRACKEVFGKTASVLIHEQIVAKSKEMLADPTAPAKEVVAKLGFSDTSHFFRFFKRETGFSTLEFRMSPNSG